MKRVCFLDQPFIFIFRNVGLSTNEIKMKRLKKQTSYFQLFNINIIK